MQVARERLGAGRGSCPGVASYVNHALLQNLCITTCLCRLCRRFPSQRRSVINIQNGLKFLSIVSILPQVSKILNTFVSFISKSRF